MPRHTASTLLSLVLDEGLTFDAAKATVTDEGGLNTKDQRLAVMIAYTALRHYGPIHVMLDHCLKQPYTELQPIVRDALLIGAAQLLYLKIPDHAALAASVDVAPKPLRGLVNAILRRLQREREKMLAEYSTPKQHYPGWFWKELVKAYGKDTAHHIVSAQLAPAPLDITLLRGDVPSNTRTVLTTSISNTYRLPAGTHPAEVSGFEEGDKKSTWQVQDAAAALPATLFPDLTSKLVLDLCAAPGGKTAQLAAAGAEVVAIDSSAHRLQRLSQNMQRLQLSPAVIEANLLEWKPPAKADAILLDAPCSATGTLRRHPELLWRRSEDSSLKKNLQTLQDLQENLLARTADWLKPGGMLIYAVCSLLPSEGEQQIAKFLENTPSFKRLPLTEQDMPGFPQAITEHGDLRTLPHYWAEDGGLDGFYACRLVKEA